jgi:ketosteroid isomerase-like protein
VRPSQTCTASFTTSTPAVTSWVVQLALQGTHDGALHLPFGMVPPTGERMDAPCCDVFTLTDGKIERFDCYPEGSVILSQLGVLSNSGAVLQPLPE